MPCNMNNEDTGLVNEKCIWIAKGPTNEPWMSPDISLKGIPPNSPPGTIPTVNHAYVNGDNKVDVTVHRRNQQENECSGEITTDINIDIYVCKSSLITNIAQAKPLLGGTMTPQQLTAGSTKKLSDFGPPNQFNPSSDLNQPDGPGHKCLIARCYPSNVVPDATTFCLADPHIAQHNIEIVEAPSDDGQRRVIFPIDTLNVDPELSKAATLRVIADLNPSREVLNILIPILREIPSFQWVTRSTPDSFSLQLPDFSDAQIRDKTRLGCLGRILALLGLLKGKEFEPKYEADIQLQPGQVTSFNFTADLSRSSPGDAHIFHLMHVNAEQRILGGLTLVAVAV